MISDQQVIDTIAAYKQIYSHPAYHCHYVKTPNFDRLVLNGYSFIESHSVNPVSTPGRACVFTGVYATENGVIDNNIGIDPNVPNMGEWFQQKSNYNRVYCGKWHAGGPWNYPEITGNRKIPGFDTMPVAVSGTGDFNDYQVSAAVGGYIRNYNEANPFLIVAAFMNPHDIAYEFNGDFMPDDDRFVSDIENVLPPNQTWDYQMPSSIRIDERSEIHWRNLNYYYRRMVEKLDSDVGRLLDAVEERDDETLVVFTSDHGEAAGRHKRQGKWDPFEESIRVPLIFYLKNRISANKIDVKNIVKSIDIFPTLCDYAGIESPPNCKGQSLRELLEEQPTTKTFDTAITEYKRIGRVVRHGDFKYIKEYSTKGNIDKPYIRISDNAEEAFVACEGRLRYKENGVKLLFNIKNDPWEMKNLATDTRYKDKLEEMEQVLIAWEKSLKPGKYFIRQ